MDMYAMILFDREIHEQKHFIVPGGYEVQLKNGKKVAFDFRWYEKTVCINDRKIMKCSMRSLDTQEFPAVRSLCLKDIEAFTKFFVFTGYEDDPPIRPVKILHLEMEKDGDYVIFPETFTEKIPVTNEK